MLETSHNGRIRQTSNGVKQSFNTLWLGIREPFKKTNYIFLFLVSFFIFFSFFVLIPVWTVLGNTLAIQLDIFIARRKIRPSARAGMSARPRQRRGAEAFFRVRNLC